MVNGIDIGAELAALADPGNAAFVARLIPTIDPATITGARNPEIRKLAKRLWREDRDGVDAFLATAPHSLLEENLLHAFLLDHVRDPEEGFDLVERFLPHVDNWAVCDGLNPGGVGKDLPRLEAEAVRWMASEHTYTCRFGVCMHMIHFLGDAFRPEFLAAVGGIESDEYYVHMVQGWYFATALAKQPDDALAWLVEDRLPAPVRRKAIQKSIESRRIPDETKDLLRRVRASIAGRG